MTLLSVALTIIVIGVLLWLALKFIPMEPTIQKILIGVVVLVLVLWLLNVFGLLSAANIPINSGRGNSRAVGCSVANVGMP